MDTLWRPPDFGSLESVRLGKIRSLFAEIYPAGVYGGLAADISRYWVERLSGIWEEKPASVKEKDLKYKPRDPLSRVQQKAVVIAYADSVYEDAAESLPALESFLQRHFPAVAGLHILPPCEMSERRFNDGGFSQIRRDRVHRKFGTNAQFEALMEKFFSMTDFVLNHVDIEHPRFQQYLEGDDTAGNCFYLFSEAEYQKRRQRGDFDNIFRPRPFPLFSIFRRKPGAPFDGFSHDAKTAEVNRRFRRKGLSSLPEELVSILFLFEKIRNDQMLLAEDYQYIARFKNFLDTESGMNFDAVFTVSETQETRHTPYIFHPHVRTAADFLSASLPCAGVAPDQAGAYAGAFAEMDAEIFGEPVRALTTFSHVQVDLNTSTYEGLCLLADDLSWYLQMDLNMLRLDAANFAFKKWGTTCFGLPEVRKLLKIVYLSMESVSPRMIPNLEVNAPLSAVLGQMADPQTRPPMMYDFHLAAMLPVVFNTGDARPLLAIRRLVERFDIPPDSIRFSLDESHDGKSVSGSGGADPMMTYAQRAGLLDVVQKNGGFVKYKSIPTHVCPAAEFEKICGESGLDAATAVPALFNDADDSSSGELHLKEHIQNAPEVAKALGIDPTMLVDNAALKFLVQKLFQGREPYELCVSTWDALERCEDPFLAVKRYLAFKTLAFALMGRHVKATFFNDLIGLGNDLELVRETGELRNIKRTRSRRDQLERRLARPADPLYWIAGQINDLLALVDADPAFGPRGEETTVAVDPESRSVACLHACCREKHTLVVVNTGKTDKTIQVRPAEYGLDRCSVLWDHIRGVRFSNEHNNGPIAIEAGPFDRYWIKGEKLQIPDDILFNRGSLKEMRNALAESLSGNSR